MVNEVNENDWKLYRKRLPDWQENYMDRLNHEYIQLLCDTKKNASDRFWELERRIKQDKYAVGVSAEMRRSKMYQNLISLIDEGAITIDDLEGFSEELIEKLKWRFVKLPYKSKRKDKTNAEGLKN